MPRKGRPRIPPGERRSDGLGGDSDLRFSPRIAPIWSATASGATTEAQARQVRHGPRQEADCGGRVKRSSSREPRRAPLVLEIKGEETPKMPQGVAYHLADVRSQDREVVLAGAGSMRIDANASLECVRFHSRAARGPNSPRCSEGARCSRRESVPRPLEEGQFQDHPRGHPDPHFLLFGNLPKERDFRHVEGHGGEFLRCATLSVPDAPALDWEKRSAFTSSMTRNSFVEFVRGSRTARSSRGTRHVRPEGSEPYVAVIDPLGVRDEPPGHRRARRPGRSATCRRQHEPDLGLASSPSICHRCLRREGEPPGGDHGPRAYPSRPIEPRNPTSSVFERGPSRCGKRGGNHRGPKPWGRATPTTSARSDSADRVDGFNHPALLPPSSVACSCGRRNSMR